MARIGVIYDFHDEGLKPFHLLIHISAGELDGNKPIMYIPLQAPFEQMSAEDLEETGLGVSVLLSDITASFLHPHCFGIDMQSIRQRHKHMQLSIQEIERFVVRICDIEEVLQSDMREYYSVSFK